MPKVKDDVPFALRAFRFLGVNLRWGLEDAQAKADCPFCGHEGGKFSVAVATGKWGCWSCRKTGNPVEFLRQLWETSAEGGLDDLAAERGLLDPETLTAWGVRTCALTDEPIVPGYDADGNLDQLYSWRRCLKDGAWGHRLMPTPGVWKDGASLRPMGVKLAAATGGTVFLCEGCWDGMALWEALRRSSHGADARVVALPSANVWKREWGKLLEGARVVLCLDNDHPKEAGGTTVEGAGSAGSKRIAAALAAQAKPPTELLWVRWGEGDCNLALPSGYDLRDWLKETA